VLSLPHALSQYWFSYSLGKNDPAYFQVTSSGELLNWGGAIERYGSPTLKRGEPMGEIFPFLADAFPLHNVTESMQWIQTDGGLILDAHFCFEATEGWILFVESGDEARKVQSLVQQGNELRLLRQNYDNIVQRQLTPEKLSSVLESLLNLHPDLSGKVSIMLVRLNLDESDVVAGSAQDALKILNQQLQEVFKVAIEEGGWIHHVFGQTVAILFGLFPSSRNSAQQAIKTAHQLGKTFQNDLKLGASSRRINLGVGITTGELGIEVRPIKNRQIVHMIGQTLFRAENIFVKISPGCLLIDHNTYSAAADYQTQFSLWSEVEPNEPCTINFYAQPFNE
jgi:hypothetical protein